MIYLTYSLKKKNSNHFISTSEPFPDHNMPNHVILSILPPEITYLHLSFSLSLDPATKPLTPSMCRYVFVFSRKRRTEWRLKTVIIEERRAFGWIIMQSTTVICSLGRRVRSEACGGSL